MRHLVRSRLLAAAVVLSATTVLMMPSIAGAAGRASSGTITTGLVSPLGMDPGPGGTVLVTQTFAGLVSRVERDGSVTTLADEHGGFTPGVGQGPAGTVYYTTSDDQSTYLKRIERDGSVTLVADLGAYELAHNPDAGNHYGFQGLTEECLASLPPDLLPYTGVVDSDPYAIAVTPQAIYVAEAAGNAILKVTPAGAISTVAVLPPRPTVATAEIVAGAGLPECVTGSTYDFEPVPTDVEIGPGGTLYVSSLPGGPEDASLGPRGGVFRVNAATGASTLIATGALGATDLAVTPNGTIYVAALFSGEVDKVVGAGMVKVAQAPAGSGVATVEWAQGRLLITTMAFDDSSLGDLIALNG